MYLDIVGGGIAVWDDFRVYLEEGKIQEHLKEQGHLEEQGHGCRWQACLLGMRREVIGGLLCKHIGCL